MELRDYLKIIGKRIWILVVSVIIVTLVTYLITKNQPIVFEGSFSTNVLVTDSIQTMPPAEDKYFKYDNYYAWQASSLFADNITSWLKEPANISEIYTKANVGIPTDKLKNYSRLLTVKKNNPATIQVSYSSKNENEVKILLKQTKTFIIEKTQNLLTDKLIKNVAIDASEPIVIAKLPDTKLNTLAGLVGGIIVGFALVFFVDYMKRKS